MSSPPNRLLFLLLLLLAPQAPGVEALRFSVAGLSGAGWAVHGLEIELAPLPDGRARLGLRVARLELPAAGRTLEGVELSCPEVRFTADGAACEQGRLRLPPPWAAGPGSLAFSWTPGGRLTLRIGGVPRAGARLAVTLAPPDADGRRRVELEGKNLAIDAVASLLDPDLSRSGWTAGGRADFRAEARLGPDGLLRADWRLHPRGLEFTAPPRLGLQGGDIDAVLAGQVRRGAQGALRGEFSLEMRAGGVLGRLFYLGPGAQPLRLESAFALDGDLKSLALDRLRFRHPGVLEAEGEMRLGLQPFALRRLRLQTAPLRAEALYDQYLRGTALEAFVLKGGLRARFDLEAGGVSRLVLDLDDFSLEDNADPVVNLSGRQRYALRGVEGRVVWTGSGEAVPTRLSWRGGHLLETLTFGSASLEAELLGRELKLLKGLDLPVLDGRLVVDRLDLALPPDEPPQLAFDAVLTPVSMRDLSLALGWPELAGSLSGVIPGLSFREGVLKVDGNLLVRLFDGNLVIRRLRLADLFGVLPTLAADVEIDNLDLETLTRTFSFGKITGRLDGRVDRLYLEGWRPVSFDARLATPPDDDSPHFINQRAVDNISNLGGAGIGGALSRSFLGLFEEFRYARLGISCRLEDGVCHMGGVAPAEQGYYLVVGSGIPQINIVGFTTRTDWNRLVEQLQQIQAGEAPVIQ